MELVGKHINTMALLIDRKKIKRKKVKKENIRAAEDKNRTNMIIESVAATQPFSDEHTSTELCYFTGGMGQWAVIPQPETAVDKVLIILEKVVKVVTYFIKRGRADFSDIVPPPLMRPLGPR